MTNGLILETIIDTNDPKAFNVSISYDLNILVQVHEIHFAFIDLFVFGFIKMCLNL